MSILDESPIPLSQAAGIIPPSRGGKGCHLSTVLRWVLRGVPGPDGTHIRLEGLRLGGRWLTSREALERFSQRLTPNLGSTPAPAPRTPEQRHRAAERAAQELKQMGI
jgi:hypothetical protein